MNAPQSEKPKSRRIGSATSVMGAAEALGINAKILRAAIKRGQINVISFGGLDYIHDDEIERLKELFGIGK